MSNVRSNRADVRNPVMALPEVVALIEAASPEARQLLADLLLPLSRDFSQRGEKSWRTRKAPMALYWKELAVYARHIRLAVRP